MALLTKDCNLTIGDFYTLSGGIGVGIDLNSEETSYRLISGKRTYSITNIEAMSDDIAMVTWMKDGKKRKSVISPSPLEDRNS